MQASLYQTYQESRVMEYKLAKDIAVSTCYLLQPYCDKINIAGGIRRKKADVHDIEIMAQPKTEFIKIDLFENTKEVRSQEFINIVNKLGHVKKGQPTGKMMQIELVEKIVIDLFMPEPHDYFRQFAVRTGSRDYSEKVIATGWVKIGWVGSDQGLRKKSDCVQIKLPSGAKYWKCVNPLADLPPCWESEKHFFEWLMIRWVEPQNRNL